MQLIEPLRAKGNEVVVYGKDAALSIYRREKMDCTDLREVLSADTQEAIAELVGTVAPDLIVTGTSSEDSTERRLWTAAERAGISSFAVLDQWTNYRLRFIPEEDAEDRELVMPSFLFVMDELAKQEMIALGIDGDKLIVTGQPFFDYIRRTGERFTAREIEVVRRELSDDEGGLVFVFVSQPIASLHRKNGMAEDHWGYTETTVLTSVTRCLEKLTEELRIKVTLVIRLHPKDEVDAYGEILTKLHPFIKYVFDRKTDSSLLLQAADLVMGMFSMVLLEAAILDRPFISVQIGLKRESPLIFDRMGSASSILTEVELEKSMRAVLQGNAQQRPELHFEFGAVKRIVEHLEAYK